MDASEVEERIRAVLGGVIDSSRILSHIPSDSIATLAREVASSAPRLGLSKYDTPSAVLDNLILPAFVVFRWLSPEEQLSIIDVGAGCGAMGLALALSCPSWRVHLIDRRKRATSFVEILILRLGVPNATAILADAHAPPSALILADAALFRAVASPASDLQMAQQLTRPGGLAIIWTSPDAEPCHVQSWSLKEELFVPAARLKVMAFARTTEYN